MSDNKHEALVRKMAEEMASSRKKNWHSLPEGKRNGHIANAVPAARIAVRHMAEAFDNGYWSNKCGCKNETGTESDCKDLMEEFGLIPSPNQPEETGK